MKRWVIMGLIGAGAIVIVILVKLGLIRWETLSILAAPFVAVFKGIGDLLRGKNDEEQLIKQVYDERRARETEYQGQIEESMKASNAKVEGLVAESAKIDAQLAELSKRRQEISRTVDAMSTDQLAESMRKFFSSRHAEG